MNRKDFHSYQQKNQFPDMISQESNNDNKKKKLLILKNVEFQLSFINEKNSVVIFQSSSTLTQIRIFDDNDKKLTAQRFFGKEGCELTDVFIA